MKTKLWGIWLEVPIFPMNQESHFPMSDQVTSVSPDLVQTSSNSSVVDDDDIDTTLRLGGYVSRKSAQQNKVDTIIRLGGHVSRKSAQENQVDTTLSLSPPGSDESTRKRRNDDDQMQIDMSDADVIYNPLPLQWFPHPGSCWKMKRRRTERRGGADHVIYNPLPLQWFPPDRIEKKRRRRERDDGGRRVRRRRNPGEDENQRPSLPVEEIPGLFQTLERRGGSAPVFLYGKKLEGSDVKKGQNRLFVTRDERVLEFLTEEEAAEVKGGGKGMKIVGIDGGGNVYDRIGLTKWGSLEVIVINSDWGKLVDRNNAEKGDVVEIWGYRENHKPCLAFNFRREGLPAAP